MPCIVLYSIVLYWASPNLWYSMYCIVFFCIVLTSPNMAQSHQDSLSWLCLHLLLINCVSVLAWCVYLYNVQEGSCCEFDQVWEDPPIPLPSNHSPSGCQCLGQCDCHPILDKPLKWRYLGFNMTIISMLKNNKIYFGNADITETKQTVCFHAGPLERYV